jgi:hypothetical protein
MASVLLYWARGKKRNAAAYPPNAGPGRQELMQALSLDYQADIDILAAQRQVAA